ncbi:translation elongation factor-like protein [Candidatus Wolfebacteria bacterium]|nr:translation elongation factor-like protein [Candidatus Wolfebacteria bacterium]
MAEQKPIGEITHYYGHLGVAIIKFKKEVSIGDMIHFKGPHIDFIQKISSMQFDHKEIEKAKKGQIVGIKVKEKVHESDGVYEA